MPVHSLKKKTSAMPVDKRPKRAGDFVHLTCANCGQQYKIGRHKIPPQAAAVKCAACGQKIQLPQAPATAATKDDLGPAPQPVATSGEGGKAEIKPVSTSDKRGETPSRPASTSEKSDKPASRQNGASKDRQAAPVTPVKNQATGKSQTEKPDSNAGKKPASGHQAAERQEEPVKEKVASE